MSLGVCLFCLSGHLNVLALSLVKIHLNKKDAVSFAFERSPPVRTLKNKQHGKETYIDNGRYAEY